MTGIILINLFITALIFTLCACGVLITLFGAFVFTKLIIMPNKAPADVSNRINHIRLVWFAIQSPELFVPLFSWLKNDEYDNVKHNDKKDNDNGNSDFN